jgi:hypothetical protein
MLPPHTDDELEVGDERPPRLGDAGRLRMDGAHDLTQLARVFYDLPREFVGALVGQLDHDLAGRNGDLVCEFGREGPRAVARDSNEEFLEVRR